MLLKQITKLETHPITRMFVSKTDTTMSLSKLMSFITRRTAFSNSSTSPSTYFETKFTLNSSKSKETQIPELLYYMPLYLRATVAKWLEHSKCNTNSTDWSLTQDSYCALLVYLLIFWRMTMCTSEPWTDGNIKCSCMLYSLYLQCDYR